jgi:hypothetical protein
MVEEFLNKVEEWNKPTWQQVDSDYLQKLEENVEYYKTFVKMVESEVDFFNKESDDSLEVIDNVKEYLEQLREVLH